MSLQVKFLRALESRAVTRIGAQSQIPVDIRVIAATNKNLKRLVEEGHFREDLFYRLNVVGLEIPPLRERKDDIPVLALKFLQFFNKQYGQNKKITYEVMKELENYAWRGSVRQLRNVMENMVVVSNNEYLQLNDLPWGETVHGEMPSNEGMSLHAQLKQAERQILEDAKKKYGSSRKMADALQVDQSTVIRKLKHLKTEG